MTRRLCAAFLALTVACSSNMAVAQTKPARTEAADPSFALRVLDGMTASQWSLPAKEFLVGLGDRAPVASYRVAAEAGDVRAQAILGFFYCAGVGGTRDDAEAVRWLRLAADRGNLDGQTGLGLIHDRGFGVVQNHAEAARWYQRAADQGYANAQVRLGVLYEEGLGVAADPALAIRLYRQAADGENPEARFRIGTCLITGTRCGAHDPVEGRRLVGIAAEQGYDAARAWIAANPE